MLGICFFTLGENTTRSPDQEGEMGVGHRAGAARSQDQARHGALCREKPRDGAEEPLDEPDRLQLEWGVRLVP